MQDFSLSLSLLPQEVAEGLGMLVGTCLDPRATKSKKKKVFGFLSKSKVANRQNHTIILSHYLQQEAAVVVK